MGVEHISLSTYLWAMTFDCLQIFTVCPNKHLHYKYTLITPHQTAQYSVTFVINYTANIYDRVP